MLNNLINEFYPHFHFLHPLKQCALLLLLSSKSYANIASINIIAGQELQGHFTSDVYHKYLLNIQITLHYKSMYHEFFSVQENLNSQIFNSKSRSLYNNSLVNADSFDANFTKTNFQKVPISHLTCTYY